MSLIKQFPEIESFFKKNKFSQENLDALIQEIEKKYNDVSILNSAKSFIKLELLKFDLQKVLKIEDRRSKNKSHQESLRPQKSTFLPRHIRLFSQHIGLHELLPVHASL